MGASTFVTIAKGKTADQAFEAARAEALYEHGHGGYTGSIAEKSDFVMIRDDGRALTARLTQAIGVLREQLRKVRSGERTSLIEREGSKARAIETLRAKIARLTEIKKRCRARMSAEQVADVLIDLEDDRIEDKWGPAGCIDATPKKKRDKEFVFFGWASS